MKVMSIFGTRPEMIKMWGTLKKLDNLNFEHVMVHTGQNHTPELKDFFFDDLKIRKPDFELGIDTSNYGAEVADVIKKSDEIYKSFLTPKNYRIEIKKIELSFNYNFDQLTANLNDIKVDELINQKVKPARAQVLITKPIENLHIKGTFHLDRGYENLVDKLSNLGANIRRSF